MLQLLRQAQGCNKFVKYSNYLEGVACYDKAFFTLWAKNDPCAVFAILGRLSLFAFSSILRNFKKIEDKNLN